MCQNGGWALARLKPTWTGPSNTPLTTTEQLKHPETSLNTPQYNPRCPLTFPKINHKPTDIKGHKQTLSDTPEGCLRRVWGLSWSVWRCLALSVGAWMCLMLDLGVEGTPPRRVSDYLGDIKGCLSCFGCSRVYRRAQSMWASVWPEPTHHFGTSPKCNIFFTWLFWDIKISKPLTNMVQLCHFF